MKINIINKSNNELPDYATIASAGMDLRAFIEHPFILQPMERKLIATGLFIELPIGYETKIRLQSTCTTVKANYIPVIGHLSHPVHQSISLDVYIVF